jgi:integrase
LSIQNRGRNRWRVVVKTGERNPDGRPRYIDKIIRGTKQDAVDFEASCGRSPLGGSSVSLGAYLARMWLPSLQVAENTARYYEQAVRVIEPALGHIQLKHLTASDVEAFVMAQPAGSLRARAKRTLSAALRRAWRLGLICENVMDRVVTPGTTPRRKPTAAYTREEAATLLAALEGDWIEAAAILMLACCMRKEEALALDWQDIPASGDIEVSRAYTCVGHKAVMKDVKTHCSRIARLRGWPLGRVLEIGAGKDGPVCAVPGGGRCHPSAATRRFQKLVKAAGIRYRPISTLRHTGATLALSAGADVAVVSGLLGHSRVSTTVDYYIRPHDGAREQAAAGLAELVTPPMFL